MADMQSSEGVRILGKGEIKPKEVPLETPNAPAPDVFARLDKRDDATAASGEQNLIEAQRKNAELSEVVTQLRAKMAEIDRITNELDAKRKELERNSPMRSKRMLEEIILPPLEMLK